MLCKSPRGGNISNSKHDETTVTIKLSRYSHRPQARSLLTPTLPSRVLRPLSSPFLCLEVELPLVLWLPSLPLPVPLDKEVDDWLTVLFRLACSVLGVRWRPDMEGEGTGSSFFSKDLLDLIEYEYPLQHMPVCPHYKILTLKDEPLHQQRHERSGGKQTMEQTNLVTGFLCFDLMFIGLIGD